MFMLPTIVHAWPSMYVSGKLQRWYMKLEGYETAMGVEP